MIRRGAGNKRRKQGPDAIRSRLRLRPSVIALEGRELLSTLTVSNTGDSGAGSLLAAVAQANSDGGGDTIVFSSLFDTSQTITLTGGQLALGTKATTTITGPGANLLTVNGNKASRVFDIQGGSAAISGLTITGGNADSGAGLLNNGGTLTLTDAALTGNVATDQGGGLATQFGGTTTLVDCTVSGNSAGNWGGGLFDDGDTTMLTNCTISGNTAGSGGGMYNYLSNTSLTNCTVSGNFAAHGGGLTDAGGPHVNATITLTNTIVAAQKGGADILVQNGSVTGSENLIGDGSGISGGNSNLLGTPEQPIDPLLAPLGDYGGPTSTMALLPGSPAIGEGAFNASNVPATDQRGAPRGTVVDIGAVQNSLVVESTSGSVDTTFADLTVPGAVVVANQFAGAAISFDPAFVTPQTIALTAPLILSNSALSTTITGATNGVTISGGNAVRVLQVEGSVTATLSGLTITGGLTTGKGGGVYNAGTLTLAGCTVSGNSAANDGGGLYNLQGAATLTGCTVSGNSASQGGGLTNYAGALTLTDCTVSGNRAVALGGGLSTIDGVTTLIDCTVSGNSASNGGGLYTQNVSFLTLTDCTVSGNSADNNGGGLLVGYNTATTLTNTIVAGQKSGGDITGAVNSVSANNLVGSGAGMTGISDGSRGNQVGTAQAPIDPLLAPLGDYGGPTQTFPLLPGSPAIGDAGAVTALPSSGVPDTSSTSFPVPNGLAFAASSLPTLTSGSYFVIQIDSEQMAVVGLTVNGFNTATLDVVRGVNGTTAATHSGGASVFLASDQRGYTRDSTVATDNGAFQSQGFTLTPVTGSTPQSAAAGSPFANPLAVSVRANNVGQFVNPVDGGVISFAAPAAGASATLSGPTATITATNAGDVASVTATTNSAIGAYIVSASASGAGSAAFALTNTAPPSLKVTTKLDVVNHVDGLTSLRAAIAYANSHPGPDTIIFDPASFGTKRRTIRLVGGPLVLTDPATTTILGPGANRLTLSGGRKSRVFDIEGGSLALEGLTITGGRAVRGGGILNDGGTVALDRVVLRGNHARVGGGLFNDGKAALTHVVIRGNSARVGSGLFSTRRAMLSWRRSPTNTRAASLLWRRSPAAIRKTARLHPTERTA
jgi:fibronectin-binding autotransporter adhesin